ncbi:MAG: signal peptide peptidase SppA [Phycisphaerae bacterium]|nr:signal peptide peptidase SppA [Phycisphaerae bacterium]
MRRVTYVLGWLVLLGFVAAPAYAVENEKKPDSSASSNEAANGEEQESPIQRLVEVRIDEYVVPARAINIPLPGKTKTLQELREQFKDLAEDDRVGAVLLDIGTLQLSMPDIEELRASLELLKNKGKKVSAFLNLATPNGYLLACAADEIVVAPTGNVVIPGLGRAFPFLKGYYQMVGMEYDVVTAGRFKYPGFVNRREPDKFFLEEFNAILDGWIGDYMRMIGTARKLSPEAVKDAINHALFRADEALQRGLVDRLAYYDECKEQVLRRGKYRLQKSREEGLANVNSLQDLMELINEQIREQEEARKAVGPKIAVLQARGPIIDMTLGPSFASQVISREDFVKVVRELRKNDSIKAVVMHVDSPGGSGYASDVIWQELRALDDVKPLVVSMGSVAGSGGYYIACPARKIFAHPTTITGSIGVIGIFPSMRSMLNRMDYEMTTMQRGERALLGSGLDTLSPEERQFLQDYISDFYSVFVDRVATGRRMPAEVVRQIAEGRIYTGRQAKELRLIDELGSLSDAIDAAREMANIPPSAEVRIVYYPRASSLGELLEGIGSVSAAQAVSVFSQAASPAPALPFDAQLKLFSSRIEPLCWMAVPPFYEGATVPGVSVLPSLPMRNTPAPALPWAP